MKKRAFSVFIAVIAVVGLLASSARADLGLAQIVAGQGAPAVGQAVLAAAQAVYAANTDPATIQSQLIAILNEAAATGNEQAIRYAIVAVIVAGGAENLELSKTAINNSNAFNNYETLTAITVAESETLLNASGGDAKSLGGGATGGGNKAEGGNKEEGGGQKEEGGGTAGGGKKEEGGGKKEEGGGGDKELGGGDPRSLGGGSDRLFPWEIDPNNPFNPGGGPGDNDVPATGV